MKTVKLTCSYCGIEFEKPQNEYNRSVRSHRILFYCTRTHAGLAALKNNQLNRGGNIKNLVPNNKRDEYTGFRDFYRRIKRRSSEEISLDCLKSQWDKQNGKCIYTGIELTLPGRSIKHNNCPKYKLASLDRIDSSRGYIPNNIQFVSVTINYAKNTMSHNEMKKFIKLVRREL